MSRKHPRARALAAFAFAALAIAGLPLAARAQSAGAIDLDEASPTALARRAALEHETPATQMAGPVDPKAYRLGPGDRLVLHVRGAVARDVPLEVEPEGTILVPNDGLVYVAGRTLADVREEILRRVRQLYRNVDLQLRLSRPRTFRVYLTGQIEKPGPDTANGSYRVADVLTPTMLLDGASQRNILVLHTDATADTCDLQLFLTTGDASRNPWLRDGDVIQVPPATRFAYAEGALARPGRYEVGPSDNVRTLLRLAGDPLPSALVDGMQVVRFSGSARPESSWVELRDVLEGRTNPAVEDGERLYVYFVPRYRELHQVTILGEVERPGTYPIQEGRTTLRDLLTSARGLLPRADVTTIRVHRAANLQAGKDPEFERLLRLSRSDLTESEYEVLRTRLAGLKEDYTVDWGQLRSSPEHDLLLRDGDLVRIDRPALSIRVDGEVRRPGLLNYVAGRSVDDFIEQAGGYTNRAWRGKVRVTRAVTGQTLLARNVQSLDPGDFVWVPEKPDITQWQILKEVLVALSQVATVVIAIRSVQ